MLIHDNAVISPQAKIADNVKIGPFCVIGAEVEIDSGCELKSHIVISGKTKIAKNNIFYPFATLGETPQDLKFNNEESLLEIGNDNIFREHVTIHSGTDQGNPYAKIYNRTIIGNNCLFMVGAHVAHDCLVGDRVVMANNATIAGHVTVGNDVIIGGLSAVQQFVRIGDHTIIGGMSGVENDVVPYAMIMGERAKLIGLNITGLRRRNFSKEQIKLLNEIYTEVFFSNEGELKNRIAKVKESFSSPETSLLIEFLEAESKKALCQPKK